LAQEFVVRIFA